MPRRCAVCTHPQREEIDAALVRGDSIRGIAPVYAISRFALGRHKRNHLPETLAQALEELPPTDWQQLRRRDSDARLARRVLVQSCDQCHPNLLRVDSYFSG